MKIALIVPYNSITSEKKHAEYELEELWEFQARKRLWSTPSLSLLTVAGMMPEDFELEYIDLNYREDFEGQYDWAFFSPSTSQAYKAYEIADSLRKDGIKVAMGGVHASMLHAEALKHSDVVFIGESEETIPVFLEDVRRGKHKSIYKAEGLPDLRLSSVPRYDLAAGYPYKSFPIQTTRGCPHQCNFCVSSKIYGKKIRRKSIEQVGKELEAILKIKDKPFVFFTDDNLFVNEEYSRELVGLLKRVNLRWYAFTDASIYKRKELLKEIRKAGCTQLLIGFESLDLDNLGDINKSQWKRKNLEQFKHIISEIQGQGIGVVGSFVLGLENDTLDTFDRLYEFIQETCLYATNITVLTPFPGTEIYERLKREGRITVADWSKYNGFELTFETKNMKREEFEAGWQKFMQQLNSPERLNKVITFFKGIINAKYENEKHQGRGVVIWRM